MSFDYFVAVHRQNWPTAESFQASLERLGYPLRLADAPPFPLEVKGFSLPVSFEGRSVVLEADVAQATDADDPESLFGYIAQCAAENFKVSNGDFFLTLTFRSDANQIRAGLYLAAAMILEHDGYGFENQAESHGSASFARQLISEASDAGAFERPVPEMWVNPDFRVPTEASVEISNPKPSAVGRLLSFLGIGRRRT